MCMGPLLARDLARCGRSSALGKEMVRATTKLENPKALLYGKAIG